MDSVNFSNNLAALRKKKKVTQEELANFLGVTKASVSKWETRQSLPDVLLLPRLASYFDVSIDELLGYAPQLSREQIQKHYHSLSEEFASGDFEGTVEKCVELMKKYYSCYPLLFQISVLLLNHFMLAESPQRQQEILELAAGTCGHILSESKDMGLCSDTLILRAQIYLIMGKASEVIDDLEDTNSPYRLARQSDSLLIQAYCLTGETDKAVGYSQMNMYLSLMSLLGASAKYMELRMDDLAICEETMKRCDSLIAVYGIDRLNPNSTALFNLQAALVYCAHGKQEQALDRLEACASAVRWMLTQNHLSTHGDGYFDRVAQWYENSDLGAGPPRSMKVIKDSALGIFANPAFESLRENQRFIKIMSTIKEVSI